MKKMHKLYFGSGLFFGAVHSAALEKSFEDAGSLSAHSAELVLFVEKVKEEVYKNPEKISNELNFKLQILEDINHLYDGIMRASELNKQKKKELEEIFIEIFKIFNSEDLIFSDPELRESFSDRCFKAQTGVYHQTRSGCSLFMLLKITLEVVPLLIQLYLKYREAETDGNSSLIVFFNNLFELCGITLVTIKDGLALFKN